MSQRFDNPASTPAISRSGHWPMVSVLVVNHNGEAFLEDCLASLETQSYPAQLREIIVIDNASTDRSIEIARRKHPNVRIVELDRNRGFAGGNNEGLRHAKGDMIALLNNDAVAHPNWLAALVDSLESEPSLGGAASRILFRQDPGMINSAGISLYEDGRGGDRGFRQIDGPTFDRPADVFGPCGAAMLLRRALIEDVGFFDERFFLYYEDLDLAWRARLRSWRFRYEPRAVVHHVHCGTTKEWSPFFVFHVERNRAMASLKNARWSMAMRGVGVLYAKVAWQCLRVLLGGQTHRSDRDRAIALLRAGASLVANLPAILRDRRQIQSNRRVSEPFLRAMMLPAPPRSATQHAA